MVKLKKNKNISIKEINKINILRLVMTSGPISRVAIANHLDISRPTVTEYVRELLEEGLIEESGKSDSSPTGGKKAVLLTLNGKAGYIFAVMIGVKSIRIALTDLNTDRLRMVKIPTEESKGPKNVIENIVHNIDKIICETNIEKEKIIGIGVGATGLVDSHSGTVIFSPNLKGWSNIELKSIMEDKTSLLTFVDNECRLQAIAEKKFGLAKNIQDFVCVGTGIGIGTGVFLNNNLLVGNKGIVGEVGHIIINIEGKKRCHCGNIGCLETLCSTAALLDDVKHSMRHDNGPAAHDAGNIKIEDLYGLYLEGDKNVVRHVEKNAVCLGIGISNAIKMFNPEIVIIHGEVIKFKDGYLKKVRESVAENTFPMVRQEYHIEFSRLGENVGLMGAASIVFENIFNLNALGFTDRHIVKKKSMVY